MRENYDNSVKYDIAFVIDSTGDMEARMPALKSELKGAFDKLSRDWERCGRSRPLKVRIRLIDFADFQTEGEQAIRQTEFFTMPEQRTEFEAAVDAVDTHNRGGDMPENGLEALYTAMLSDWVKIDRWAGEVGFHMIVLLTSAYPLALQERKKCPAYPDSFPKTVEELEEIWSANVYDRQTSLDPRGKSLLLVAPEGMDGSGHTWDAVFGWENTTVRVWENGTDFSWLTEEMFYASLLYLIRGV